MLWPLTAGGGACPFNVTEGMRVDGNDLFKVRRRFLRAAPPPDWRSPASLSPSRCPPPPPPPPGPPPPRHQTPNASATSADCCSMCASTVGCHAFVHVAGRDPGKCWLKASLTGASRPDKDCTAGGDGSPPPPPPAPTPPPTPNPGCATDEDCNMAGTCDASGGGGIGACNCDVGWTGGHCEKVNFGDSYACGEGGLCLHGELNFTSSWGGGAVRADDGSWHVYAASFARDTTLSAWLSLSRVVHGRSEAGRPEGPYTLQGVALTPDAPPPPAAAPPPPTWDGETQHNPAVVRAADGTYLLYYMGAQAQSAVQGAGLLPEVNASYAGCPMSNGQSPSETVCMQRVGLASSKSPEGPWTRRSAPVLQAGEAGQWDDLFTTNPTPHAFPNGSVLLIYKARSRANPGSMSTGVAFAEHYSGPYVRRSAGPIDVAGGCEDAGIYFSPTMNVFRMLLHCGCNYQSVWSRDGTNWVRSAPVQPWCNVTYANGAGGELLKRRERPKWIIGEDGQPTHLLTGVSPGVSHNLNTFTMATAINR
jgi:hypothetical protein